MARIHQLAIVNSLGIGGAERLATTLAQTFDRTLIQPMIVALWENDPVQTQIWQRRLNAEGIPTFVRPPGAAGRFMPDFRWMIRYIGAAVPRPVDIVHSHAEFSDMGAAFLKRRLGARAIVRTAHNVREWPQQPLRRMILLNGPYLWTFDRELAVSQRVADVLDRRPVARLLQRRATVAYNAIDLDRFTAAAARDPEQGRRALGLPPGCRLVGAVGRLTEQKGYRYLVQAAAAVVRGQPDIHFVLAGAGELADALHEQVRTAGIAANFHFLGARADIEAVIASMDVFVSSSLWEGLPTVLLEAMAAGVPVIATRVAGTTELVEDGVTGVLVAAGDAAALQAAILARFSQPESARAMAARAEAYVRAKFDIRAVARQHEVIYQNLLKSA